MLNYQANIIARLMLLMRARHGEEAQMDIGKTIRKLADKIKPPCPKCPYTLGIVKFVTDPCRMCKLNDYNVYYNLNANTGHHRRGVSQ